MPFIDHGNQKMSNDIVAEAIAPDPCFWTPELPFLYGEEIVVSRGSEVVAKIERSLGIRRLGVRERSLLFDGKRFVLRAVGPKIWGVGNGEWGMKQSPARVLDGDCGAESK